MKNTDLSTRPTSPARVLFWAFAMFALPLAFVLGFANAAHAKATFTRYSEAYRYAPGTIVIHAKSFEMFLVYDNERAIRYPVAAPQRKHMWSGGATVTQKHWRPAWSPPAIVKRDHPELPDVIAGGDPKNPMGIAAISLSRDQIAIHGTSSAMRSSMGSFASYGCIRMLNEDIEDLYARVSIGQPVVMRDDKTPKLK